MIYVFLSMLSLLIGQVIINYAFGMHDPFLVVTMLYIIGATFCLLIIIFSQSVRKNIVLMRDHAWHLCGLLFLMAFNAGCFFAALYLIGLSGIATLSNVATVSIILGGVFIYGESLDKAKLFLISLTLIGVCFLTFSDSIFESGIFGLVLALLASLSWALIHFYMKNISANLQGLPFAVVRTLFLCIAFVTCFILYHGSFNETEIENFQLSDFVLLSLSAIFTTILTYTFMPLSLRYADLSTIAIVNALRPLLAFIIGILFFNEALDNFKLIAAILGLTSGLSYSVYIFYDKRKKSLL